MSIHCLNRVWNESTVGGSELLVLLAIADHAHDDGSGAWPSKRTIARKAKISERQVTRIIQQLEDKGELAVERAAGPYGTNAYTVLTGLTRNADGLRKCYMCGCHDDGSVDFKEHQPDPERDDYTIDLCADCDTKLHQLVGGDKLSPPLDTGGDTMSPPMTKTTGGVTKKAKRGDIAMSPDPSLTVLTLKEEKIWKPIKQALQNQMGKATFEQWFGAARLIEATDERWTVQLAHPNAVTWVEKRLMPVIVRTMEHYAPGVELHLTAPGFKDKGVDQ